MEICPQKIGCLRDCTLYLLITLKLMARFEQFLTFGWVLLIEIKFHLHIYQIFTLQHKHFIFNFRKYSLTRLDIF